MEVKLALLADYANLTNDGKLNILGVFDVVRVVQFPAIHPQMQLVLRLGAQYAERDRPQRVEISLDDPDGRTLLRVGAELMFQGGTPGRMSYADQILTFAGLRFERPGGHTFNVFINNDLEHHLTLEVEQVSVPEQPQLPGI